jgi:hypothetical protein
MSPVDAAVEVEADKCQEVVTLYHALLPIAKFARLLRCIGEV